MVRAPTFLRALVASAGLVAVAAIVLPAPAPAAASGPGEPRREPDTAPLRVRIASMAPATLPTEGPVRITGSVTNRTEETWRDIDLYPFVGDSEGRAIRTPGRLAATMSTPYDALLGDRVVDVGRAGRIRSLAPGATATYSLRVPARALQERVTRAGVYWFGVHALGSSATTAYDLFADGRARTLLPNVPRRYDDAPLPVALVVPLTAPVRYESDGSLAEVASWQRWLGPDGRLTRLLDFVDTGPSPVTWVVDPAVIDAVGLLARGNPPRELGPTGGAPADDEDPATDGPTSSPGTTEQPAQSIEPVTPEAQAASAWLTRLGEVLRDDEVLTLPYGNVDVPAAVRHDSGLLGLARAQRSTVLADLGVETSPVVMSPSGYLDRDSIASVDRDTPIVITDRAFTGELSGGRAPAMADVDGHRVIPAAAGVGSGTPGPGRSDTSVGLRQRLLAEGAVRLVRGEPRPLTVVLPLGWGLSDAEAWFEGLDVPWLEPVTLDRLDAGTEATPVDPEVIAYPRVQARRELDVSAFTEVDGLIDAGDVLQDVLLDDDRVGGVITEEALTGVSYGVRRSPAVGRLTTAQARTWVEERLDGVRVSASKGVTLSGASGTFVVTLQNTLEQSVVVGLRAESDDGLEITAPDQVELAPRSRTTVLLDVRATGNRVHNVTLMVTDVSGRELGSSDSLPIRSAQVSDVIWLIMGTGAGLLFLAIAIRLVRRIRSARRTPSAAASRSEHPDRPGTPVEVG